MAILVSVATMALSFPNGVNCAKPCDSSVLQLRRFCGLSWAITPRLAPLLPSRPGLGAARRLSAYFSPMVSPSKTWAGW